MLENGRYRRVGSRRLGVNIRLLGRSELSAIRKLKKGVIISTLTMALRMDILPEGWTDHPEDEPAITVMMGNLKGGIMSCMAFVNPQSREFES